MAKFQVVQKKIPACPNTLQVFQELFAASKDRFFFESSVIMPGFSRFSFMGDSHGPSSEAFSYSIARQQLTLVQGGRQTTSQVSSFFDFLDQRLRERRLACAPELPFDFNLGYAGFLGYELKAETIGRNAYDSGSSDASFLFVTRMIAFDHLNQESYLLYLIPEGDSRRDADAWFAQVEPVLMAKSDSVAREPHLPRRRMSIDEVKRWIDQHGKMRHSKDAYIKKIHESLHEILHGESYEVCLTNLIEFPCSHEPFQLYQVMRQLTPSPHAGFLDIHGVQVVSGSPERFMSIDRNGYAEAKPIKGTRPRGQTPDEDERLVKDLATNEKDIAENLMIVDLLRNDYNQFCKIGTVHTPKLFQVETYSHFHQLVSTIQGQLKESKSAVASVRAAFPGGSMTGAPKKRTMEIIDRLEEGPRGVYSGAMGWFGLSGACDLNIMIRSLIIENRKAKFGVGGAIMALSDPEEEFTETIVKARGVVEVIEYFERQMLNPTKSAP